MPDNRTSGDEDPLRPLRHHAVFYQQTKSLTHQPLGTVAIDGIMETLLGNDNAGHSVGVWRFQMPRNEETSLYGTSPVEDTLVSFPGESRGH